VTRDELRRRLGSGHLHRVHRGVYAAGHANLTPLARSQAALLAVGPHAALSHRTAAVAWQLLPEGNGPIHVTHNPPHRRGPEAIDLHRSSLPTTDVRLCQGLPTTSPARTLVDLAATHPDELARALNEALVRRLVRPAEIRPRGRGAAVLRALLASGPAPTRSEAERRLLGLLGRAGLPRPRTNVRLHGYEVDALWPQQRLIVEVDGFAAHGTKRAFERDRVRDTELQLSGYRVLRLTWQQLTAEPERVLRALCRALDGGGAPGG
jgi:very-short-patch-repair endonuclease